MILEQLFKQDKKFEITLNSAKIKANKTFYSSNVRCKKLKIFQS